MRPSSSHRSSGNPGRYRGEGEATSTAEPIAELDKVIGTWDRESRLPLSLAAQGADDGERATAETGLKGRAPRAGVTDAAAGYSGHATAWFGVENKATS